MSWPYVAGFFDGEGSVRLYQRGVQLTMAQSKKRGVEVLTDIKMFLASQGITSSVYQAKDISLASSLYATGRENVSLLMTRMMPYLHVKKSECQDILRYFRIFPARVHGNALALCISRGRQEGRRSRGKARLQDEDVREIRMALSRGETGTSLASKYGVHFNTIYGIKGGVSWTWLT